MTERIVPKTKPGLSTGLRQFELSPACRVCETPTQVVAIDTPGAPGAQCIVSTQSGPQTVVTPGSISLNKSTASLPVRCSKECYLEGGGVLSSSVETMAAGNLVFGGIVGVGVDAASGALNKYPDQITISMVPDPACRDEAPPVRRRTSPRRGS